MVMPPQAAMNAPSGPRKPSTRTVPGASPRVNVAFRICDPDASAARTAAA